MSALQQTRGQLLKVSDQISASLRSSQEQLEEARANAAELHAQLHATQQLLQHANETLLIKVRMRNLSQYYSTHQINQGSKVRLGTETLLQIRTDSKKYQVKN